ncbi:MAG: hypothetical protein JWM97_1194, partial [Phycisphaerales bacterium]|nr:hypothetical protein [Phycisphaerales bacterium]
AKVGGIAAAVITGLIVTAIVMAVRPGAIRSMTRPQHEARAVSPPSAAPAQAGLGPIVQVPGPNTMESSRVTLFQRTADNAVHVVYADNHTETITLERARNLLATQTGKTLEQLTRDGP